MASTLEAPGIQTTVSSMPSDIMLVTSSSTPSLVLPGLSRPFPVSRAQEAPPTGTSSMEPPQQEILQRPRMGMPQQWDRSAGLCRQYMGRYETEHPYVVLGEEPPAWMYGQPHSVREQHEYINDSWDQANESFGDMSAVSIGDSALPTPAQLRPAHAWSPETPPDDDEPPPYDGRVSSTMVPRTSVASGHAVPTVYSSEDRGSQLPCTKAPRIMVGPGGAEHLPPSFEARIRTAAMPSGIELAPPASEVFEERAVRRQRTSLAGHAAPPYEEGPQLPRPTQTRQPTLPMQRAQPTQPTWPMQPTQSSQSKLPSRPSQGMHCIQHMRNTAQRMHSSQSIEFTQPLQLEFGEDSMQVGADMPERTDLDDSGLPDTKECFVFDGEEVQVQQHHHQQAAAGLIPTPARSRRLGFQQRARSAPAPPAVVTSGDSRHLADAAVQTSRASLEGNNASREPGFEGCSAKFFTFGSGPSRLPEQPLRMPLPADPAVRKAGQCPSGAGAAEAQGAVASGEAATAAHDTASGNSEELEIECDWGAQWRAAREAERRALDEASEEAPQQQKKQGRPRLISIIRRSGAPYSDDLGPESIAGRDPSAASDNMATDGAAPPAGSADAPRSARTSTSESGVMFDLGDLVYPTFASRPGSEAPMARQRPTTWRGRAALAQAVSEGISSEFEALAESWGLDHWRGAAKGPSAERAQPADPRMTAVAVWLSKVARQAERACVLSALQPLSGASTATDEEELGAYDEDTRLEARCAQLEAEKATANERLAELQDLEADLAEQQRRLGALDGSGGAADTCRDLQELTARISQEAASAEDDAAASRAAQEVAEDLRQCHQRLALMDMYLNRTLTGLDGTRRELAERERAAAEQGFSHLPGGGPNGLRALASLR